MFFANLTYRTLNRRLYFLLYIALANKTREIRYTNYIYRNKLFKDWQVGDWLLAEFEK